VVERPHAAKAAAAAAAAAGPAGVAAVASRSIGRKRRHEDNREKEQDPPTPVLVAPRVDL
jgi:hypothetical protein